MPCPSLESLISHQIQQWNDLRHHLQGQQENDRGHPGPVLTVSRLAGSGGRTLATELAKRLGLDLQDQSMLQDIGMTDQCSRELVYIVTRLAERGGVVFLGRGAHLILKEKADLRIRVVAPDQCRIENLRRRLEITRAEARLLIEEADRRRQDFVRKAFHTEPGLAENYDLILNSHRLGMDGMIDLVLQALLQRQVLDRPRAMGGSG